MAMGRDGLLPPFFSDINKNSYVPVKSTIVTGLVAATLAFFMDVSQLAGMVCLNLYLQLLGILLSGNIPNSANVCFTCILQVSVGTLLAFTVSAISVLVVRYIPPIEVSLLPSLQEPIEYDWSHLETLKKDAKKKPLVVQEDASVDYPLIPKNLAIDTCELSIMQKLCYSDTPDQRHV